MPHGSAMRALEVALQEAARGTAVSQHLTSIRPMWNLAVQYCSAGCDVVVCFSWLMLSPVPLLLLLLLPPFSLSSPASVVRTCSEFHISSPLGPSFFQRATEPFAQHRGRPPISMHAHAMPSKSLV